ncbi:MAG: UDP-N-acetylmuramoyl-tripeptide--D-alanyl-D-alanine ligase [Bacteroidota bacterium]|nr:UDP-N-acetylmuramoyl-tripeptide--D-alanyl-D-alanine ligase [Bacteroidota bacterium]
MEHNRKIQAIDEKLLSKVMNVFSSSLDITTDSRKVKQGSIFVALKGENFNGNSFSLQALESGASLVIIDEEDFFIDQRTIVVENSLLFLQKFANYYRKTFSIPFLAISGTNGKTTTKELISTVLQQKYEVFATFGNLNNQIGVPLSLLSIKKDCQIAVIEMGASHIGDIDELCQIAEPTCCLLTNVGTAHIEGFGSMEGVLQTKTELYKYVNRKGGKVFVNYDDENLRKQTLINKTTYSLKDESADVFASVIKEDSGFACIKYKDIEIHSNLVGEYNAYNILSALSVALFFEIPIEKIKYAIENYIPQNNRSQIERTKNNTLILDCYNANPSSCLSVLSTFDKMKAKDKRAFFGAMKELGEVSQQEHQRILDKLLSMNLQEIILVGKEYKAIAEQRKEVKYFDTSLQAKEYLEEERVTKSLILIKGSRSTKMEVLRDVL